MKNTYETLYSRDSKGKILQWNTSISTTGTQVDILTSYGEYGGKQALRWQRDIKGVNIGKSNETTPYEQAQNLCESSIKSKKRKGYMTLKEAKESNPNVGLDKPSMFTPLTEDNRDTLLIQLDTYLPKYRTDLSGNLKPMKAQQYYRSKKNWEAPDGKIWDDRKYFYLQNPYVIKEPKSIIAKFPCMGQPKINGVRAFIRLVNNTVKITSKDGLEYNIPQVSDFLTINSDIFLYNGIELILDGELYIHQESLQNISSAVNKISLNTARVTFQLFDIGVENIPNEDRWNIIKDHIKPKLDQHLNCPIELVKTTKIENDYQAQQFTDYCIDKKFEGAMFRQFDAYYGFGKRPIGLVKLKRVIDDEFIIQDVLPQTKDPSKGNFLCITKQGLQFEVNPRGTDEYKQEVLTNKENYIGKQLTCVFYEWTDDNKPFHIIDNTVRDYE